MPMFNGTYQLWWFVALEGQKQSKLALVSSLIGAGQIFIVSTFNGITSVFSRKSAIVQWHIPVLVVCRSRKPTAKQASFFNVFWPGQPEF